MVRRPAGEAAQQSCFFLSEVSKINLTRRNLPSLGSGCSRCEMMLKKVGVEAHVGGMNAVFKAVVFLLFAIGLALLPSVGCRDAPTPQPTEQTRPDSGTASNRNTGGADSAVTGTVSYSEDIPLSPGAVLEVELHDVSLIDVASKLIARQVVSDLGRPPVPFKLEYDRDDIQAGNVYAVQARIKYGDGSLAFVNDTAYEVITQGRSDKVDMVLVMVSPPPGGIPGNVTPVPGDWVVVAADIRVVETERTDDGYLLRTVYSLPGGEDCARLESSRIETVDRDIYVALNILGKRDANGSPACASPPAVDSVAMEVEEPLARGEAYRVRINDQLMAVFTPPHEGLSNSHVALSPIESADLVILEMDPPRYNVVVTSALPRGSSCSQFNGFAIERSASGRRIDLLVTHHEVSDPNAVCTEDYPTVDITIPLGKNFESGEEYHVFVNGSDSPITFQAQ